MTNITSRLAANFRTTAAKALDNIEDRMTRRMEQRLISEGADLTNVTFEYHND